MNHASGKASNAVLAKARALYGRRLRAEDYRRLTDCRTMTELANELKALPLYANTLAEVNPTYARRAQLENLLETGMRVLVPFGKGNRSSEGLVLSLEQAEETHRLKEIQTLLDRRPVLTPEGIQLALWMRERFFCTV